MLKQLTVIIEYFEKDIKKAEVLIIEETIDQYAQTADINIRFVSTF